MRRWLCAGAVAALVMISFSAAATAMTLPGPQVAMHVTPHPVGPRTTVVVRFRQPVDTTRSSALKNIERLGLSGPQRSGCVGQDNVVVPAARFGAQMKLTLRPARLGGHWCVGVYRGTLTVSMMPRCGGPPVHACPEFIIAPRTVGHFSFRVTAQ